MKVKVELNKDQDLPLAVIYTDKMTEEVERAVAFLESSASSGPLIAQQEDRLVIIKPSDVILVRVEGGDTVIYTGKGKYFSRKRLYEVYQQLGQDFMQISKQAVVNLTCLESVEASFNETMFLRLEHGLSDYIKEAYRITPIKKKPYYGCILGGRILCTFDGLRINTKMEVLDENHDPIPGLYAAGNDAGGFFWGSYNDHDRVPGLAASHTHTFGRLAGQSAAGLTADEPGKAVAQEAHVDAASGASHI
ncbi:LytTR family DNA-binding domain-containing protein [Lactobacillus delbrueckii]|uniref:LytTR family DNA-binding domain-containing protein n=1 Tax=Lactobacillus delbrueckii TaxID=1584 RepID=UPI0000E55603|nr:LytTR family DNA-binding domain-containing protein [Lactobacillus delbrueckii]ABJ58624.1 Response regulator of the LytR/AlgR family [Lactobacillus delbrueckii subsp. bulgaricus ATCC BAA-365]MBT8938463.1 hypothetical protein [Lactobacillus delbrueckii subsp. bulgaricus]